MMATPKAPLPISSWRSRLLLAIPFVIVLLAALVSLRYVKSGVPADLYLLAGPPGSTFYQDGLQYKAQLEPFGVKVHVVATTGSSENLRRLATSERPQAGFAEAGVERRLPAEMLAELVSLGSLYIQPAWLFFRNDLELSDVDSLAGHRVIMGTQGSGARILAELLIEANGIEDQIVTEPFDDLTPRSAVQAIEAEEVDAMFATGLPDSPVISQLLLSKSVRPLSFTRSAAYARRFEYLAELDLPEGTFDLALNIPGEHLQLIGLATNLVVSEDLHPAVTDLLLSAGREIHGKANLFTGAGTFPSATYTSLPLSRAAKRFFEEGPSAMRRLLPFWLATLIDRFLVVICSVATAAVAAFGILPRLLTARFDLSLMLLNRQLSRLENSANTIANRGPNKGSLLAETEKLLQSSAQLRVPTTQAARYLEFRQAVHDLRERLRSAK